MNRRDFLKYSSLILPGSAAVGILNPFTKNIFAAVRNPEPFSLTVITDQPSKTIHTIEQAIKYSDYGTANLTFDEYSLQGSHIGDIAYIKARKLVDYRKGIDEFSHILEQSAKSLSLPDVFDNPTLLRFSSQSNMHEGHSVNIFRGDSLIKKLSLDREKDLYRIDGMKGYVDISIKNHSVKVISASCKHKTCMSMTPISRPGENLICIPNQVNVVITGKSSLGVDSITF